MLRRRLETEAKDKSLAGRQEALIEERDLLGRRLEDKSARLEAMRQQAELLAPNRVTDEHCIRWNKGRLVIYRSRRLRLSTRPIASPRRRRED